MHIHDIFTIIRTNARALQRDKINTVETSKAGSHWYNCDVSQKSVSAHTSMARLVVMRATTTSSTVADLPLGSRVHRTSVEIKILC
jgi:hypothetical protein